MPKAFICKDFLLETETAKNLYEAARSEPIYDYHCHLPPAEIAANRQFANLAEIWLSGDHYKWRMMRAMGIDEFYITGAAAPYEKFLSWARTVENLIGNPLYHWTHLELQRYFGINEPLTEKSAPGIWEAANEALKKPELSVKGIFEKFNVYAVGTTDDPTDSLEHHAAIAGGSAPIGKISTKVLPSFRPDKALNINLPAFAGYIKSLSQASGVEIKSADEVLSALEKRLDFFVSLGCRASDHGLENVPYLLSTDAEIEKTFQAALAGGPVSKEQAEAYKTKILCGLGKRYAERGIAMQLHLSALRNVNGRMFKILGPDTGYDAVGDGEQGEKLVKLLDNMESAGAKPLLPKTILYSLNLKDFYPMATIMGGFQDNYSKNENRKAAAGKMQLGTSWWFLDHKDGMKEQMKILANVGILPVFLGMLTDSRSFLSYPRHEYFRRILCNLIGGWAENGEYPADQERLAKMVKDISFGNAERYFA